MKKWWCWVWECVVVVCCCLAVLTTTTLIASYWDFARQVDALSGRIDLLSRTVGENHELASMLDGRVTAIDLNLWRYAGTDADARSMDRND